MKTDVACAYCLGPLNGSQLSSLLGIASAFHYALLRARLGCSLEVL